MSMFSLSLIVTKRSLVNHCRTTERGVRHGRVHQWRQWWWVWVPGNGVVVLTSCYGGVTVVLLRVHYTGTPLGTTPVHHWVKHRSNTGTPVGLTPGNHWA